MDHLWRACIFEAAVKSEKIISTRLSVSSTTGCQGPAACRPLGTFLGIGVEISDGLDSLQQEGFAARDLGMPAPDGLSFDHLRSPSEAWKILVEPWVSAMASGPLRPSLHGADFLLSNRACSALDQALGATGAPPGFVLAQVVTGTCMIPTPWMHCFSQFGSSRTDIIRADTSQDPDHLPTEGDLSQHRCRCRRGLLHRARQMVNLGNFSVDGG